MFSRGRWAFIWNDREFIYALIVIAFLVLNVLYLAFGIVGVFAERGDLFAQRDALPQRDFAEWQRQVLLLINDVAPSDDPQAAAAAKLHRDLAQSRVNLLQSEDLEALLPFELHELYLFATRQWEEIVLLMDAWLADPLDQQTVNQLNTNLLLLDVSLSNAQNGIALFGLELSTQAEEANQRLFSLTGTAALVSVLVVVLVSATFMNLAQRQFQEATAKLSVQKFPDQSPFPIMRINPAYDLLYANPSSKPLEQMFGIENNEVKESKYRAWLDEAFAVDEPTFGEGTVAGRQFSLISSPVADEDSINIYAFDVTDLKYAQQRILRQLSRLGALHTIDKSIATSASMEATLDVLLEQTRSQLGVDAAAIFVTRKDSELLYSAAFQGFRTPEIAAFSLAPGQSLAGKVAAERRVLIIPDLSRSDPNVAIELTEAEGFRSYFAAPLEVRGELLGVLETFQRQVFHPDEEWREFLNTLAGQAAIALDNVNLFDGLAASNRDLRKAYDITLQGWAKALELRDKETEGHSRRVTEYTMLLAKEMGIPEDQWVDVRRGAILHDIGKMGIPDEILLKPGKLDEAEWVIMKRHPELALELLLPIEFLHSALDIPYSHHEKWDGSGYPRGRKGEQIPLPARMFAIIDVWDALRSDRPYRPAWSKEKTMAHIKEISGSHFDPQVVGAFLALIERGEIQ